MDSLTHIIKHIISHVVEAKFNTNLNIDQIVVSPPPKKEMGDVATSVAFNLSKALKESPLNIAQKLLPSLLEHPHIKEAHVDGGFINLKLEDSFLFSLLKENLENKDSYLFEKKNQLVNLEFVSANPTGPLHIGHGRWAALGDSVARILERVGYKVQREFYLNDAGAQIQKLKDSVNALKNGLPIPEDGYHGDYLKEALETDLEPDVFFLEQHKATLKRLNVLMDLYFSEKSLYEKEAIQDVLKALDEKGFIYQKDGATWFRTTDFGDDKDRPLVKSDGAYTYFAPDIAYHFTKIKRGADIIIDILGADHHGYIKRISAAVSALSDNKVEFNVLLGQLVNLYKDGVPVRMSKRAGDVVLLDDVIDEVGIDAVRYMLISRKYNQSINFDIEIVKKETKDNPLFYIQYAFARISSILKKLPPSHSHPKESFSSLKDIERLLVLKSLYYKEEILASSKELEPYTLANYLFELASLFHKFYEKERVIEEDKVIEYRIVLINAIAKIIKDGLGLLGITVAEKM